MTDDQVAAFRDRLDIDERRARELLGYAEQNIVTLRDPKLLGRFIPGWHEWPDVQRMCQQRLAEIETQRRIMERWETATFEERAALSWVIEQFAGKS